MPINYKEYHPYWKTISKDLIKNRAENRCELCGAGNKEPHWKTGSKVVLTVHHIDGEKKNNSPLNLIVLCQRCHLRLDLPFKIKKRKTRPIREWMGKEER